jgi:hypothetical protein
MLKQRWFAMSICYWWYGCKSYVVVKLAINIKLNNVRDICSKGYDIIIKYIYWWWYGCSRI